MLVHRGSNAFTSIVIRLLIFFSAVPSAIADAGICDFAAVINEPIGIDLGYQYITASYANSSTIFTPLAVVNNAQYIGVVSQLSAEHFEHSNLKRLYGDRDGSTHGMFKVIISHLTSKLAAKIPYINHPRVESITSTASQVYTSLATQCRRLIDTFLRRAQERPNPLTLSEVSETFTRVFQDLKSSALADTGTKLPFAIIGIPDFFNETLAETVVEAARKAGIDTVPHALPRSLLTHFENPAVREGASVLVLHQGIHHCGIRAYFDGGGQSASRKSPRGRRARKTTDDGLAERDTYLRLDPWRSQILYQRLTKAVIKANPELETQLELGADWNTLLVSVLHARLQLKKQDLAVVYLGTESRSADFYMTIGEDGAAEYLEEVPLALDKWWIYGRNPGVKLTREMVLTADEEYVKTFAKMLDSFVRATQEVTISPAQPFDQVAILTDWVDGDLARRAVQEVLGDGVPIVGGSLSSLTMAADGAARLALIRRQNLLIMRGEALFGHDEL